MRTRNLAALAAAGALLLAAAARADEASTPIVVESAATGQAHAAAAHGGEYRLGVFASRASPALRAQLKLKEQGLLVNALQREGPAAKAGIQQYDILLKGNDTPLADPGDLLHLIERVKGGKLTLDLLRAGKHETLTVSPAKRPADEPVATIGGERSLEFRVVRPGQILPPGVPLALLSGGDPSSAAISVAPSPDFEKRLGDLQKEVDDLRRAVDALRSQATDHSAHKTQ